MRTCVAFTRWELRFWCSHFQNTKSKCEIECDGMRQLSIDLMKNQAKLYHEQNWAEIHPQKAPKASEQIGKRAPGCQTSIQTVAIHEAPELVHSNVCSNVSVLVRQGNSTRPCNAKSKLTKKRHQICCLTSCGCGTRCKCHFKIPAVFTKERA